MKWPWNLLSIGPPNQIKRSPQPLDSYLCTVFCLMSLGSISGGVLMWNLDSLDSVVSLPTVDFRLSFADRENKCPFSVSVCSKQTEVCRFRLPFAENKRKLPFSVSSVFRCEIPEMWRGGHDMDTLRYGDMKTWRHRHRDMGTWRKGDMETSTWKHGYIKRKSEA